MPALAQSAFTGRALAAPAHAARKARAGARVVVRARAQGSPLMPPSNAGKTVESVGASPVFDIAAVAKGAEGEGDRHITFPYATRAESCKTSHKHTRPAPQGLLELRLPPASRGPLSRVSSLPSRPRPPAP